MAMNEGISSQSPFRILLLIQIQKYATRDTYNTSLLSISKKQAWKHWSVSLAPKVATFSNHLFMYSVPSTKEKQHTFGNPGLSRWLVVDRSDNCHSGSSYGHKYLVGGIPTPLKNDGVGQLGL